MDKELKVIDAWINPNLSQEQPSGATQSAPPVLTDVRYLFPGYEERQKKGETLEELIETMDRNGVEKGIFALGYGRRWEEDKESDDFILNACEKYPDRFALTVAINPHKGMQALRELETWVKDYNCKAARAIGFDIQRPYDDKIYYPFYAKCIELDIPIGCNVGIPGPKVPSKIQDPMALDEVCWFFPELKVIMQHGGEPWAYLCVKLMLKWENLYYMTSAFAPKYYPPEIIHFMNTRGSDKVMFASDHPLITIDRCMREIKELPLRAHVWPKFLRENALRVFKL